MKPDKMIITTRTTADSPKLHVTIRASGTRRRAEIELVFTDPDAADQAASRLHGPWTWTEGEVALQVASRLSSTPVDVPSVLAQFNIAETTALEQQIERARSSARFSGEDERTWLTHAASLDLEEEALADAAGLLPLAT